MSDPVLPLPYPPPRWVAAAYSCLDEVWKQHRDPGDADYNGCDHGQCAWCDDAEYAMKELRIWLDRPAPGTR